MFVEFNTSVGGHKVEYNANPDGKKVYGQKMNRDGEWQTLPNRVVIDRGHKLMGTFNYQEGKTYNLPDKEAKEFIASGACHEVQPPADSAGASRGRK